jgi:iron complex transport system permease protein
MARYIPDFSRACVLSSPAYVENMGIAFVGLVAPHICRMIIGADNRFLLPASAMFGAVLLLLADTIARTIVPPLVIPIGIVTAIIGSPVFFYLILKKKGEYW